VLKCRSPHVENEETFECEAESLSKFFTPLVIIIIALLGLSILILILSKIVSCIRRNVDKTLEQAYAYFSLVECIN